MRVRQPCSLESWLGSWEQPEFQVCGGGSATPEEARLCAYGLTVFDLGSLSKDKPGTLSGHNPASFLCEGESCLKRTVKPLGSYQRVLAGMGDPVVLCAARAARPAQGFR